MPILKSLFSNEGAFFVPQNLKTKQWESIPMLREMLRHGG
jgi:hypothetical protein